MYSWLTSLIFVAQMISALAMIGLVLVQHGKGADMGASFGSGASGSLFGATGSANFFSRSTAVCATIFFVSTLLLAGLAQRGGQPDGKSFLDQADKPAVAASAPASVPLTAQIPGVSASEAASVALPASAAASK